MAFIRRLSRWLVLLFEGILGLSLGLMSLAVLIQVVLRTFFKTTWPQMDDLVTYAFSISVFIGASLGFRANDHLAISFLTDRFRGTAAKTARWFSTGIVALFLLLVLIYGGQFAIQGAHSYSPLLGIPMWPVYAVVPLMGLATLVFLADDAFRAE